MLCQQTRGCGRSERQGWFVMALSVSRTLSRDGGAEAALFTAGERSAKGAWVGELGDRGGRWRGGGEESQWACTIVQGGR